MAENETETRYQRWYDKNKQDLAAKRKQRYDTDPEYRQKVIDANRARKEKVKQERPVLPDGYTKTMNEVATDIDVSVWSLREWRKKSYYPEPFEFNHKLYFTDKQVKMLNELKKFFEIYGKRRSAATQPLLDELIAAIHKNWG